MAAFIADQSMTDKDDLMVQCYLQLAEAVDEFEQVARTLKNYSVGIDHLMLGINILVATIRDPAGAYYCNR